MPLLPGDRVGAYEVLAPLGAGGMGEVYRARDLRLERDVALKFLPVGGGQDAPAIERFLREARAASALNHPNIITIHEIGNTETGRYLVMELVEGRTLRDVINDRPSVDTVARVGAQISQALSVAHAAGIVHRDIKPENIMVRADGYVKLLDFGLARVVPESFAAKRTLTTAPTAAGMLIGTVRYMSPEQAAAEPVDSATDIFSLGLVLYELATGRYPFAAESSLGVLRAILSQRALSPSRLNPEIPQALDALILRMLEQDSRLRPDASVVANSLSELVDRRPIPGMPAAGRAKHHVVGRDRERSDLVAAFGRAADGHGSLVCISGEPGIGKTTLIDDFLDELGSDTARVLVGRGRCSERLAGVEAYLPLFEMLESLIQGPSGDYVARVMKLMAPSWYLQIAPLAGPDSSGALTREMRTISPERLKRELTLFIQEVSRTQPLVLVLDDVHWIDLSSTDVFAYVAGRFDQLPVLAVAAYRPTELLGQQHPFASVKLDLEARGACREIALTGLERSAIERYVALEFPQHRFPSDFTSMIHAKTEGSPLFASELLHYLRHKKVIVEDHGIWRLGDRVPDIARELPDSVRSMIQQQIERLDDVQRRLLGTASVQGQEFDAAVVSRVLGLDAADVEERIDQLDRVHGLVRRVDERELPDHTPTLRYRFAHVLYQNTLYLSLTPSRKASLSAAVAQAILHYYREESASLALQLALLFEAARDFARAAEYFTRAATNDARIAAYQESILLAGRGLEMVRMLPDAVERSRLELDLQLALGQSWTATKGYAAPEVEQAYTRARALCQHVDDKVARVRVLEGLCRFYAIKPDLLTCSELADQLLDVARETGDDQLVAAAHVAYASPYLHLGESARMHEHLEQATALCDPEQSQRHIALTGADLDVRCHVWASFALWMLGFPDQAQQRLDKGLVRTRTISHPFTKAFAFSQAARYHHCRREPKAVQEHAEAALDVSIEHAFGLWVPVAHILHGWALAEQGRITEGIDSLKMGLELFQATGTEVNRPHFLSMLADALARAGKREEALDTLGDALAIADRNHDIYWNAELFRLKGTLLLPASRADSEACFRRAIEVARRQGARLLELRAVTSLSRLWQQQGKASEAQGLVRPLYDSFSEGNETVDLREARIQLLDLESASR